VTTDSVVNTNVGDKTMAVIYLNDEDQDFLIFHMKLEAECGKEADAVIANRIINKIINSCIKDTPRCLKTIDMEIQNDIHE
tara:strand:- start:356 stop:598 length:243 start_codon:yes stop_codon:yes gene_type:complete